VDLAEGFMKSKVPLYTYLRNCADLGKEKNSTWRHLEIICDYRKNLKGISKKN
jgi:hypothetical protein